MTGVPLPVLLLLPSLFVLFHELHAHFPLSPSHQVFTFDFSSLRNMIVLFFQMIHEFLRIAHLTSLQLVRRSAFRRWQSSSSYDSRDNDLIPPTTCCMSNCANCKAPSQSCSQRQSVFLLSRRCLVYIHRRHCTALSRCTNARDRRCSEEVHRRSKLSRVLRVRNKTTIHWK